MLKAITTALSAAALLYATPLPAQVNQVNVFGRQNFQPTKVHRAVYEMMEECSGRRGNFDRITWAVAQLLVTPAGEHVAAMWGTRDGHPFVIIDRQYVFDAKILSHEALHDLFGGPVPMDVANHCVLIWHRLRPPNGR